MQTEPVRDEFTQKSADALRQAMHLETEGEHFYRMAASSSEDPGGRRTFSELADEERKHYDFLKLQLGAVVKTGAVDERAQLGITRFSSEHPVFSQEIRLRLKQAHFEVTALSIGIQLERNSIDFYQERARETGDARVREFFADLALWEQGHLAMLRREADRLRDDYWQSAHFAPF
jgi:rubrerythrin